jgi:cell wall-associated NlpC family hydrolase
MARSDAELDRLEAAAAAWVGTPYADNSAVRGRGVCCHLLMREIYQDAGWLHGVQAPKGSAQMSRWANTSPMLDWFQGSGSQWFAPVPVNEVQPGDVLLVKCGHVAHHLALVLRDLRICHVTQSQGVRIVRGIGSWQRLVAYVFRPRIP